MSGEAIAAILAALGGGFGIREYIGWRMKKRDEKDDAKVLAAKGLVDDQRQISVVAAGANASILETLLKEMRDRIDSYEGMIREMKDLHAKDIAELKAENKILDRQVRDLQITLRDWQLGNKVPRGQVLIPLRELKKIRERHPGLLDMAWYAGEDITEDDPSIVARITPLPAPAEGER